MYDLISCFTLSVVTCLALGDRLAARWQRKGYSGLFLFLWLLLAIIGAWTIAITQWYNYGPASTSLVSFAAFAFSPLFGLVIVAAGVFAAPQRAVLATRRAAMTVPYGRLAELTLVLLPIALIATGVAAFNANRDRALRSAVVFFAYWVIEVSRRIVSVYHRSNSDPRPPVLFLREFRSEPHFLSVALWRLYRVFWRIANPDVYPFEDLIVGSLRKSTGPVIALGNPLDVLPPGEAERVYVSDDNWKEEFGKLASKSGAVLIQAGVTANLEYEIRHLFLSGLGHKVFVIVPPETVPLPGPLEVILAGFFLARRRSDSRWFETPAEWTACRMLMESVGFSFHGFDPGRGSVVAFDTDGVAVLLADGLTTSDQIARTIQRRLERTALSDEASLTTPISHRLSPSALIRRISETGLMGLLIAAFVLIFVGTASRPGGLQAAVHSWGNFGPATTSGEWWRLLTALFVHARAIQLITYSVLLLGAGKWLERRAGRYFFVLATIGAGVLSGVAVVAIYPFVIVVGGAGLVLGVYGVCAGMTIRHARAIPPWTLHRQAVFLLGCSYLYGPLGGEAVACVTAFGAGSLMGLAVPTAEPSLSPRVALRWAVVTAAVVAVTGVSIRLVPPVEDASPKIQRVAELDSKTIIAFNQAGQMMNTGRLSQRAFEESLQNQLLPTVLEERQLLSGLGKLQEDQQNKVDYLITYLDLRRESWELVLRGLRESNAELLKQSQAREVKIQETIARLQAGETRTR